MADYLMTIKCGDKKFHISTRGKDVYFSRNKKEGGTTLKGVIFYNNELKLNGSEESLSETAICQQIKKSSSSSKGCFISSAVCVALDKNDNCDELKRLWAFRGDVLLMRKEWAVLVEHYYKVAPQIAKQLATHSDSKRLCDRLYQEYIEKCLEAIQRGDNNRAINIYREMLGCCQGLFQPK